MYVNKYIWKVVCLAQTSPVVRMLFTLDIQEFILHRSVPGDYERHSPYDVPRRKKCAIFSKTAVIISITV
jgi:hypothetical protein